MVTVLTISVVTAGIVVAGIDDPGCVVLLTTVSSMVEAGMVVAGWIDTKVVVNVTVDTAGLEDTLEIGLLDSGAEFAVTVAGIETV